MKYDWSVLFGLKVDYRHKQYQKQIVSRYLLAWLCVKVSQMH